MLKVFLDLETIPDQTEGAIDKIAETLEVKAPDLTKPKLIELLGLDPSIAKFKTVPELKDIWLDKHGVEAKTEQAREKWLKTSFDGGKGQICCIGWACHNMKKAHTITGSEVDILNEFNEMMIDRTRAARMSGVRKDGKPRKGEVMFIAHNAKFDLPFLHKRFVINQIEPQFKTVWHGRHGQHHYCTMEEWAGFGGRISQDNLCEILGLPTKPGMTGADVWPEYQKGNIEKIAEYCKYDVETVIQIYKRLTFS